MTLCRWWRFWSCLVAARGGGWRGLCATGKCAVVGEEGVGEWRRASVGCPGGRELLEGWVGSKAGSVFCAEECVSVCV